MKLEPILPSDWQSISQVVDATLDALRPNWKKRKSNKSQNDVWKLLRGELAKDKVTARSMIPRGPRDEDGYEERTVPPEYWAEEASARVFRILQRGRMYWPQSEPRIWRQFHRYPLYIAQSELKKLLAAKMREAVARPPRTARITGRALEQWCDDYVNAHVSNEPHPNREVMLAAAKETFSRLTRDQFRPLWKKYAPESWQKPGAPKKIIRRK